MFKDRKRQEKEKKNAKKVQDRYNRWPIGKLLGSNKNYNHENIC